MDNQHIIRKLQQQDEPAILFTDIDGTLFSPNLNILTAPLFNIQTSLFLKKRHMPFIIVTGRSFWRRVDRYHLNLLGVPQPDAVVTGNGTIILYKNGDGYVSDFTWQGYMQSTKFIDANGTALSWNKLDIINTITEYLKNNNHPFFLDQGNTYIIRIRLDTYSLSTIEKIKKDILQIFPKGILVTLTEKLLWKNTTETFSGEMLITPSTAGKDKAVRYLLDNFSSEIQKPIHAFVFGDATVDIPMLTMKEDIKHYIFSQYLVHPTPLAKKLVEKNSNLHVLYGDGPKEILWTLRPELRPRHSERSEESQDPSAPLRSAQDDNLHQDDKLTPAQNNPSRKIIKTFEKVLDRIVDKNLSPNEVSFLGLTKLSRGLQLLHKKDSSLLDKTKGLYHYSFGNLTDVLDGIRARNSDKKEENGQLVDGFSDRAKEFMQLFARAQKRLKYDEEQTVTTLLTAISCALPSIARAQVEISGKAVSERDEQGGSMIDRTKRLFLSLLFETLGLEDQSYAKDMEIYTTNLATYNHRLSLAKKFDEKKIDIKTLSDFQKKALERFLLYVDVMQQENILIKKYLAKRPKVLIEYKSQSGKIAKSYMELPVEKLRKKWEIKDYGLEIKDYL